jgi:hypothetical protein
MATQMPSNKYPGNPQKLNLYKDVSQTDENDQSMWQKLAVARGSMLTEYGPLGSRGGGLFEASGFLDSSTQNKIPSIHIQEPHTNTSGVFCILRQSIKSYMYMFSI